MQMEKCTVTEHTSFRVASLTKPVFAYLVLKLVDEGVIELDCPLSSYLDKPYLNDPRIDQLTARHVLSHQTGWPNWKWDGELEFEFSLGEKWHYSGEGYVYHTSSRNSAKKKPFVYSRKKYTPHFK